MLRITLTWGLPFFKLTWLLMLERWAFLNWVREPNSLWSLVSSLWVGESWLFGFLHLYLIDWCFRLWFIYISTANGANGISCVCTQAAFLPLKYWISKCRMSPAALVPHFRSVSSLNLRLWGICIFMRNIVMRHHLTSMTIHHMMHSVKWCWMVLVLVIQSHVFNLVKLWKHGERKR